MHRDLPLLKTEEVKAGAKRLADVPRYRDIAHATDGRGNRVTEAMIEAAAESASKRGDGFDRDTLETIPGANPEGHFHVLEQYGRALEDENAPLADRQTAARFMLVELSAEPPVVFPSDWHLGKLRERCESLVAMTEAAQEAAGAPETAEEPEASETSLDADGEQGDPAPAETDEVSTSEAGDPPARAVE